EGITSAFDYLLWYARNRSAVKQREIFIERLLDESTASPYSWIEEAGGTRRRLSGDEIKGVIALPEGAKRYRVDNLTKTGPGARYVFEFEGQKYDPGRRWWGTTPEGMSRVAADRRIQGGGSSIYYVRFWDDF